MTVISDADTDEDGLPDDIEHEGCTDINNPDTDADGIQDGEEDANRNGIVDGGETDPCNPDTDGDGLTDGDEIYIYGTSPTNPDTDGDGRSDAEEVEDGTDPTDSDDYFLSPGVWLVDGSDGNDEAHGRNWVQAKGTIQAAMDDCAAAGGGEVWVKAGTYVPGTNRRDTFKLKSNVDLYGGFEGNETSREDRDWRAYSTILSGDINGDDDGFENNEDNVYHVVTGSDNATLDGFTVTGGNAFIGGGGMLNFKSSPKVVNCTFKQNFANFDGGGMVNRFKSSPKLINCTFSDNFANYGGAVLNGFKSTTTLINCSFSGNTARSGGAVSNRLKSKPKLINCTFLYNSAESGGAIKNNHTAGLTIVNSILWGNTADNGDQVNNNGTLNIRYTTLQGGISDITGYGSVYNGDGILAGDPLLDGELCPSAQSHCIDAGKNDEIPAEITTDIHGNPRITDGDGDGSIIVDMGACEYPSTHEPNTPAGATVTVVIEDVTATFTTVEIAGVTAVSESEVAPPLPETFRTCDPPIYYDIETTAEYIGPIKVRLPYTETCDEFDLRLLHYEEESGWEDVTVSLNTLDRMVCGTVMNLSPFTVAALIDSDEEGIDDGPTDWDEANSYGTLSNNPDTDGDGHSGRFEATGKYWGRILNVHYFPRYPFR